MCFKRRPRFMRLFLSRKHKGEGKVYIVDNQNNKIRPGTHLTKKQIFEKYRLHFFVAFIFLCALLFVSLGWYYRDLTREEDLLNQKIFLDPRTRILILTDENNLNEFRIKVGESLPTGQLPLKCPDLETGNTRECTWKGSGAKLLINYEHPPPDSDNSFSNVHCYRVSWASSKPRWVPHDCFELREDQWYGPSNQSDNIFPVRGSFDYEPTPYHLSNAGLFSSAVELYWLSSKGVGIIVNASDPVSVQWNNKKPGHMCVVSNFTGPLYGRNQRVGCLPSLNYTVCVGPDAHTTHLAMRSYMRRPDDPAVVRRPSDVMFSYPQWSVAALAAKSDYSQQDVEDIADNIKNENLGCNVLHLDGQWERYHGDLTFEPSRFPDLRNMTDNINKNASCSLGLQISPYFDYRATNFSDGVTKNHFVKDAGGQVPGFVRVRQGSSGAMAVLDVSSAAARAWMKQKVSPLTQALGGPQMVKAIWLTLGDDGWLPYKPTLSDDKVSFRQLKRQMADMAADFAASLTVKPVVVVKGQPSSATTSVGGGLVLSHAAASQALPVFVPVTADVVLKTVVDSAGAETSVMCLANIIQKALTLGLLRYPYVMADGINLIPPAPVSMHQSLYPVEEKKDHTEELLIRWMQLAAFFPAAKFSLAPWKYGSDVVSVVRNLTLLRAGKVMDELLHPNMRTQVENKGWPILRPLWWLDPSDKQVHELADITSRQFLVGDDLMVAPALCVGETRRSIFVPHGVWKDQLRGTLILGPKVLENYRVPLYEIPHFLRMAVYTEDSYDAN